MSEMTYFVSSGRKTTTQSINVNAAGVSLLPVSCVCVLYAQVSMYVCVNCVVVDTGILLHGWNHLKV